MSPSRIYLDYNAFSPVRPEVRRAMAPWIDGRGGNPSSLHAEGQAARAAVETARDLVAEALGLPPAGIVFTSGGAEAATAAIHGLCASRPDGGPVVCLEGETAHVADPIRELEARGVPVLRVPRPASGFPGVEVLMRALTGARLLTLSAADGETGLVAPWEDYSRAARGAGVPVHLDASWSFCRLPSEDLAAREHGWDLLSLTGVRAGGPVGAGALAIRPGTRLRPIVFGGAQERARRGGLENVAAIVGLGALAALPLEAERAALASLRDRLEEEILRAIPGSAIVGRDRPRLPQTSCILFSGLEAETLAIRLDLEGFAVSAGSACTSGVVEPPPILLALGHSSDAAAGAIRISLGWGSTVSEIDALLEVLPGIVGEVRESHPGRRGRD